MTPLFPLLLGCAATIQVAAQPDSARVYVTDYPAMTSKPPQISLASESPPMTVDVEYFAWKKYYVWVGAQGYETQVIPIRNELKIGPTIGGIFFLVPFLWAAGPQEYPIDVVLEPKRPEPTSAPAAPAAGP